MPKSSPITAPLREALIECFRATTRLVRPELRRQLILVGGAASIAHSSVLSTEDVDVAAPPDVLTDIWERVTAGALKFSLEPDGKISFDASQGFRVRIDLIESGKDIYYRTDPRGRALLRGVGCVHVGLVGVQGRDGGGSWE